MKFWIDKEHDESHPEVQFISLGAVPLAEIAVWSKREKEALAQPQRDDERLQTP